MNYLKENWPQKKIGQIHAGKDMAKCFKCGLTKHLDWWFQLECDICEEIK